MFESGRESWYNVCKTDIIPWRIWFSRSPRKSRRSNLPEGYHVRRTWYNVCKADIIPSRIWFLRSPQKTRRPIPPEGYHGASGFRVHRENPGAQISRRGTMSGGHGIMSAKQTLYHRASGFCVHRRKPGAQFPQRDTMSGGHGIMMLAGQKARIEDHK